jgi:hypothetical protein
VLTANETYNVTQLLSRHFNNTSMLDFSFVKTYLEKCKHFYHIQYESLEMFIISKSRLSNHEKLKLHNTLLRIRAVITLYKMYNKHFRFFIVLNPLKRYISRGIITTKNINGGFTYTNDRDIFIIRKEDYQKVILHELLHHNIYIHNENWKTENINKLKEHFKIHPSCILIPNEAVVETIACILHVCFTSLEKNKKYGHVFRIEKQHSMKTVKKILNLQNKNLWNEKTNAYAYTVLRNILFCNLNKFLKYFSFRHYDDSKITEFLIKHNKKIKITDVNDKKSLKLVHF